MSAEAYCCRVWLIQPVVNIIHSEGYCYKAGFDAETIHRSERRLMGGPTRKLVAKHHMELALRAEASAPAAS